MAHWVKRSFFSWWLCLGSLLWLALFSQTDIFARWYGGINPVVTPLNVNEVEAIEVDGQPGSRLSGTAFIKRQCDYVGLNWSYQGDSRGVKVDAFFRDPVTIRSDGLSEWQALIVGIPPEKLPDTTGRALHRCGNIPISTLFFDPDVSLMGVSR